MLQLRRTEMRRQNKESTVALRARFARVPVTERYTRVDPSTPPFHEPAAEPTAERFLSLCRFTDTAIGLTLFVFCLVLAATHPVAGQGIGFSSGISLNSAALLGAFGAAWHGAFVMARLYDRRLVGSGREWGRILTAVTMVSVLLVLLALPNVGPLFPAIVLFWASATATTSGVRTVLRAGVRAARERTRRSVVVIGTGPRARAMVRELQSDPRSLVRIVGFLDEFHPAVPEWVSSLMLGSPDRLERLLMRGGIDEVVIALPIKSCYERIQQAIRTCERVGVDCRYPVDLFDCSVALPRVERSRPRPMMTLKVVPDDYRTYVKRAFDILGSSLLLVVLAPVFAAIAIAIKLDSPGPVFFRQSRYGFMRRRFTMLKFRSMVENAAALQPQVEALNEMNGPVFKIRNDPRVTRVGRILRRTSLDELPQLVNVLRGEMSLVGPRPLALRDVARFSEGSLMRRFSVMPGITGLWQVSGRSDRTFEEWIALDLKYIDEWSLALELKILLKTFGAVVRQRGAC
jgi:exopolysaccharide biosynthesis polyprenyl glycosylphosphotransferase